MILNLRVSFGQLHLSKNWNWSVEMVAKLNIETYDGYKKTAVRKFVIDNLLVCKRNYRVFLNPWTRIWFSCFDGAQSLEDVCPRKFFSGKLRIWIYCNTITCIFNYQFFRSIMSRAVHGLGSILLRWLYGGHSSCSILYWAFLVGMFVTQHMNSTSILTLILTFFHLLNVDLFLHRHWVNK